MTGHCEAFVKTKISGFTLIETLLVVALIAILAVLISPMFKQARATAESAACANQLKQWGLAFRMYANDNHGWLFTTKHWESTEFKEHDEMMPNVYAHYLQATSAKVVELRNCPEVVKQVGLTRLRTDSKYGYSMNWPNVKTASEYKLMPEDRYGGASYQLDAIPKPAEFLLIAETDGTYYRVRSGELRGMVSSVLGRHSGGINILRADQHVDFVSFETIVSQSALPDDQNTWFQAN